VRVLYLHQYFGDRTHAGGTRSYEFASRLVARGHEVRVLTTACHRAGAARPATGGSAEQSQGLSVDLASIAYSNRMGHGRRIWAFAAFAGAAAARALKWPADVVFATSTPLTVAIPGVVAARRWRAPMVFEVRDLWPEMPIAVGALRGPVAIWLARRLERFAYRNAAEIVALSPGMRDGVLATGVSPERVTVIPNACDNELFAVPRERGDTFRERVPGLDPAQPLLVYAGTFGRINRVGYLVELADGLRALGSRIGVVLVGDGAERAGVVAEARQRGLLGRGVWVVDPVPKEEMPGVLAAASVCASVFAPIQEMEKNSANKFFDALAAGRPVMINYGGWQAEILRSSGAGLVVPSDDPNEAARRLAAFVSDAASLAAAGLAARRLATEEFDRERLTDRLESVLLRAAARGR